MTELLEDPRYLRLSAEIARWQPREMPEGWRPEPDDPRLAVRESIEVTERRRRVAGEVLL